MEIRGNESDIEHMLSICLIVNCRAISEKKVYFAEMGLHLKMVPGLSLMILDIKD
jgi:hypothetical protein